MASLPIPYGAEQPREGDEYDNAMPDSELLSILGAYEAQAIGYQAGDNEITAEQETALNYYNGIMDDVPAQEGCSSVVDRTVSVVVDNALAAVLKPFVSTDETVRFSPRSKEDVPFAEQATEYVNYIIECDNAGFLLFHDWFKDALLTKLGVVKVWWEEQPRQDMRQTVIADELHGAFLRRQPDYMGEEGGIAFHGQQIDDGRVKIQNIPPEEFRITPLSRTVHEAPYAAHVPTNITRSDLIEMGFDAEIVDGLPGASDFSSDNTLRQARYADENFSDARIDSPHRSGDKMALRDEYIRIDYDGDGVAELRRIIRCNDVILLNEEIEESPFAALCPIPMPHKVFGHALADRAVQEQRIGTVLWRQMLDNLYKSNNPRPVVGQGAERSDGLTAETLTDPAPGAAIMVADKTQFGFEAVPFTAADTYPMLDVLDKKIEENTGTSKAGQGLDANAIKKSGQMTATEIAQIASGKNARTEMVARIFAETGVKRLFKLILGFVTKHQQQERVIRLRNQWVPMDPRGWPEMDVSISVGLGMGDRLEQMAQADSVLETMADLGQTPYASLIDKTKVYNAVKRKFNAAGIKDTDEYLVEPREGEEDQQPPDPEAMKVQAEMEAQAAKLKGEQEMAAAKLDMQRQEALLKQQLAREQAEFEAELAIEKMNREHSLELQRMEREAELEQRRMAMESVRMAREADRRDMESEVKLSQNREGGALDK